MSSAYYFAKRFPSLSHSGGTGGAGRYDKLLSNAKKVRRKRAGSLVLCAESRWRGRRQSKRNSERNKIGRKREKSPRDRGSDGRGKM